MKKITEKDDLLIFATLSRAAARKKIYARKAAGEDRPDVAHFLRAAAESESVQARRILNNLIGRIDRSADYLATIFEEETTSMIKVYENYIEKAIGEKSPPLLTAMSQLLESERIIASFYSSDKKDLSIAGNDRYFVCPFCGCLMTEEIPAQCPVCGAAKKTFREID